MHHLTKQALLRLRSEDINITPEDAIILENYAIKTDKISDQKLLEHSGKYCGNVEVFPLTIGARTWLKTNAKEWFEYDELLTSLSIFWALANSRNSEKFVFKDAKSCRKAILKWGKTVTATESELIGVLDVDSDSSTDDINSLVTSLIDDLIDNPTYINLVPLINYKHQYIDKTDIVQKDEGNTPAIAWLIANCGHTRDYWLWEISWDETDAIINSVIQQQSGEDKIDGKDPSFLAQKQFNRHLEHIRMNNGK